MRQSKSTYNSRYRATPQGKETQRRARAKYKKSHRNLCNDYRLTGEERVAMYQQQNGLCGLCSQPIPYEQCVLDHKHETGKRRALVHSRCNMLIGWIERFTGLVPTTLEYLRRHNEDYPEGREKL